MQQRHEDRPSIWKMGAFAAASVSTLLAIVGIGYKLGLVNGRISSFDRDISKLEVRTEALEKSFAIFHSDVKADIREIKTLLKGEAKGRGVAAAD